METKYLQPEVSDASEVLHMKLWEGSLFDYSLNGNSGTWYGTDLVVDGAMTDSANWTDPGTWTVALGVATRTANAADLTLTPAVALSLMVGKTYTITFDFTSTAGALSVTSLDGLQTLGIYTFGADADGTKTITAILTGNDLINFTANATYAGTVDNVSIKLNTVQGSYPGVRFDGVGSIVTVPADATIDINGKTVLSVSAWINPASDGEGDLARIVDKAAGGSAGYLFHVQAEAGGLVELRCVVYHDGVADATAITDPVVPINIWNHVALVYNEDSALKIKLYLNGTLITLATDTPATALSSIDDDSAVNLAIGNIADTSRTFDGLISDVRIYNTARTAAQIKDFYNQTRWRYGV